MIRGSPSCNGTDVQWNQSLMYRVNDFGDLHPHPRYQGWFYHIYTPSSWELFRLSYEGRFENHQFNTWVDLTSPLGAAHFLASGISERGNKCHQGDYRGLVTMILFHEYIYFNRHKYNYNCDFIQGTWLYKTPLAQR